VTTLAAEAAVVIRRPNQQGLAGRLFEASGSTLEDAILGAWEDLGSNRRAACPVCHGELEPAGCTSCGSELS
jgi:hypothetical protein